MIAAYYLAFALFGVLTFAIFLRIARRGERAALVGYAVALALLLFKAALNHNPVWEFQLFGGWPDYVYLQSYLIFPLGLACLGLAAGLLPAGRNRRAVTILAGFLVLVSLWTERWMFVEPDTSSRARADEEHYCAQTTNYSCGPAACVSLLSQMGIDATEGEMMGLCRTPSYGGTSLFRIASGLRRKLGDSYVVKMVDGTPNFLHARGNSAILTVNKVHAIAVHFEQDSVIKSAFGEEYRSAVSFDEQPRINNKILADYKKCNYGGSTHEEVTSAGCGGCMPFQLVLDVHGGLPLFTNGCADTLYWHDCRRDCIVWPV